MTKSKRENAPENERWLLQVAELQKGIYHLKGRRPGRFFSIGFFRVAHGATVDTVSKLLSELTSMWSDLAAGSVRDLPDVSLEPGCLTVLIGYGPGVFDLKDRSRVRPKGLAPHLLFNDPRGGGGGPLIGLHDHLPFADEIRENRAAEDVVVQFVADSKLAVDRAIVETWKVLHDTAASRAPALEFTSFYLGFQRDDHRSWIDFHDGISNLRSEDREAVITIRENTSSPDAWLSGGTYLAFLRLEVDIRAWRALGRSEQELLVGRDKLTGCPLTVDGDNVGPMTGCPIGGNPIWATENDPIAEPPAESSEPVALSHIQRANHHRRNPADPTSLRIFRQGYEFLEWKESAPGFRLGLNFVSFQQTSERVIRILSQPGWLGDVNFGGDPNSLPVGMDRLLTVYAAGIYAVPPLVEDEPFPGHSIFAPVKIPTG